MSITGYLVWTDEYHGDIWGIVRASNKSKAKEKLKKIVGERPAKMLTEEGLQEVRIY